MLIQLISVRIKASETYHKNTIAKHVRYICIFLLSAVGATIEGIRRRLRPCSRNRRWPSPNKNVLFLIPIRIVFSRGLSIIIVCNDDLSARGENGGWVDLEELVWSSRLSWIVSSVTVFLMRWRRRPDFAFDSCDALGRLRLEAAILWMEEAAETHLVTLYWMSNICDVINSRRTIILVDKEWSLCGHDVKKFVECDMCSRQNSEHSGGRESWRRNT